MSTQCASPEPLKRKTTTLSLDRLKTAKATVENAIKQGKIFTIQGPYPFVRESLRSRGWVEQFYRSEPSPDVKLSVGKKQKGASEHNSSDSDDDDNDVTFDGDGNVINVNDHGCQVAPWEEENGFYGIMSRMVRNITPMFIWGVRRDCVNPKLLNKEQIVNHYGHASFTTKVGLCMHLRDLPWFEQAKSETFFPRCYRLSHEEEKQAFIDDYVLTACISLLKHVVGVDSFSTGSIMNVKQATGAETAVPAAAVMSAVGHCEQYLRSLRHEDLDSQISELTSEERDQLIQWHYKAILEGAPVADIECHRSEIESLLTKLQTCCPQFDIDGIHNVWIVKPGAKSRGRGIQCYNRLEDILKLVGATSGLQKDGRYVVQKYIEKPLLIYNTKFDIRQWFVVTDWNPFTLWFYKDCYLRFCSQEYTLHKLDESIHLSNNSIQKHYRNGERAEELPGDNMWHCEDFKDFLKTQGKPFVWDNLIYPGMKDAVINALLCSQDEVEQRKSTFELYGADFMLSEDCHPWLIEINSSPCMAASTKVTAFMCRNVLEDTMRIVLDRRTDKSADTGLFELAYRQPAVNIPSYVGVNLVVEGQLVKKPASEASAAGSKKQSSTDAGGLLRSCKPSNIVMPQNKTRGLNGMEEPCLSTHKIKPFEPGTCDTDRPGNSVTQSVSAQTKAARTTVTNTGGSKTHRRLDVAIATDSALSSLQEKLESIHAVEAIRKGRKAQQKWTSVVVRRQRYGPVAGNQRDVSSDSDSSDSDLEPTRAWLRSKTAAKISEPTSTVKSVGSQKSSAGTVPGRRRSSLCHVPTGDTVLTTNSGSKARKAPRPPRAPRLRRHRRSNLKQSAADNAPQQQPINNEDESPASENIREHVGSPLSQTGPGVPAKSAAPSPFCLVQEISSAKRTRVKPGATSCSVIFGSHDSTSSNSQTTSRPGGPNKARMTPMHEHIRLHTSTKTSPQVDAAYSPHEVSTINVSVPSPTPFSHTCWVHSHTHASVPRPPADSIRRSQAPLPSMPSFGARPVGSNKRLVLPVDCWLRYSHDAFQFDTPATRSMVMRDRDRSDIRASMQVIGLGSTARQQPLFTGY